MLYGLRTVRKSWPLFIFDVCTLCLIITALIYGVLHFNGSELYLSNGEALGYASQHITGRSIDLDGLMADYHYYPANRTGGVTSWIGDEHIWYDLNDEHVATAVYAQSGFDIAAWDNIDEEETSYYYWYSNNGQSFRCQIPESVIAATLSAAMGDTTGFHAI